MRANFSVFREMCDESKKMHVEKDSHLRTLPIKDKSHFLFK